MMAADALAVATCSTRLLSVAASASGATVFAGTAAPSRPVSRSTETASRSGSPLRYAASAQAASRSKA